MLFLSLIVGGAGFVLFVYGKKQQRWPHLVAGLLLMGATYAVPDVTSMGVFGAAVAFGLWYAVRKGW